jgi:hypothetical protein
LERLIPNVDSSNHHRRSTRVSLSRFFVGPSCIGYICMALVMHSSFFSYQADESTSESHWLFGRVMDLDNHPVRSVGTVSQVLPQGRSHCHLLLGPSSEGTENGAPAFAGARAAARRGNVIAVARSINIARLERASARGERHKHRQVGSALRECAIPVQNPRSARHPDPTPRGKSDWVDTLTQPRPT